jgi:hypothetical protein
VVRSQDHSCYAGTICILVGMIETRAFVGCCGLTEAQARCVTDFRAIELQTTFYQPPAIGVTKRWKSKAPPEFRFCLKAWQLITHTPSGPTYYHIWILGGASPGLSAKKVSSMRTAQFGASNKLVPNSRTSESYRNSGRTKKRTHLLQPNGCALQR